MIKHTKRKNIDKINKIVTALEDAD